MGAIHPPRRLLTPLIWALNDAAVINSLARYIHVRPFVFLNPSHSSFTWIVSLCFGDAACAPSCVLRSFGQPFATSWSISQSFTRESRNVHVFVVIYTCHSRSFTISRLCTRLIIMIRNRVLFTHYALYRGGVILVNCTHVKSA